MAFKLEPLRSFNAAMALWTASTESAGFLADFLTAAFFLLATTAFFEAARLTLAILKPIGQLFDGAKKSTSEQYGVKWQMIA